MVARHAPARGAYRARHVRRPGPGAGCGDGVLRGPVVTAAAVGHPGFGGVRGGRPPRFRPRAHPGVHRLRLEHVPVPRHRRGRARRAHPPAPQGGAKRRPVPRHRPHAVVGIPVDQRPIANRDHRLRPRRPPAGLEATAPGAGPHPRRGGARHRRPPHAGDRARRSPRTVRPGWARPRRGRRVAGRLLGRRRRGRPGRTDLDLPRGSRLAHPVAQGPARGRPRPGGVAGSERRHPGVHRRAGRLLDQRNVRRAGCSPRPPAVDLRLGHRRAPGSGTQRRDRAALAHSRRAVRRRLGERDVAPPAPAVVALSRRPHPGPHRRRR